MSSEYRFSLTPRLIALALFAGLALIVLLFALGYQVGTTVASRAQDAVAPAASAGDRLLHKSEQDAAAAASPLQKALQEW